MHFDLDGLKSKLKELEDKQNEPEFWQDIAKAQVVNKEAKQIENKINKYKKLFGDVEDVEVMIELSIEADDESEAADIQSEIKRLTDAVGKLRLDTLLRGKFDANNAIITLHAGAGGTEAQDWASMLYRMYTRYAEQKGYSVKVIDLLDGDEAGIKSVTFMIEGENAYGYLKSEKGVHRLVRISPFDSQSRRHTSFASVEVMPDIENDEDIVIRPEDLDRKSVV